MALGAKPSQVRGAVLQTLVFGVSPRDPLVFGTVVLLLGGVVLAAGSVPARRATRVEPLEALRGD